MNPKLNPLYWWFRDFRLKARHFARGLRNLPGLATDGLRPTQITAILNLEKSLAQKRPRALIQMASGGTRRTELSLTAT